MNSFTGSQLAVAIEDLASEDLANTESILEKAVVETLLTTFQLKPDQLSRRLVNHFMRGSTSLKQKELTDEVGELLKKLNDNRDADRLVQTILDDLDDERREIHIKRTRRSAVRQMLRAINEDLDFAVIVQSSMRDSFERTQQSLKYTEMTTYDELVEWAGQVSALYEGMFVDRGATNDLTSTKRKGIVTSGAYKNYLSVWTRFIYSNVGTLLTRAPQIKIKPTFNELRSNLGSEAEAQFASNVMSMEPNIDFEYGPPKTIAKPKTAKTKKTRSLNIMSMQPQSSQDYQAMDSNLKITLKIINSGSNKLAFSKTWKSREQAMVGLNEIIAAVKEIVKPDQRIDYAVLTIDDGESSEYNIEEVTADTIKKTFSILL